MQINWRIMDAALIACILLMPAKILQHYLNKFLISCWLSPAFLLSRQRSTAVRARQPQPPAAAVSTELHTDLGLT